MENEKNLDDRPLIKNALVLEMAGIEEKPSATIPKKENSQESCQSVGDGGNDVAICIPENSCISTDAKLFAPKEREEEWPKDDRISANERKTLLTISSVLITLSGAAIFGGLHDRIGNEYSRFIHRDLFKACSYSLYTMFFASGCLLILSFKKQKSKYLGWLVNLATCGALGSVFFATAFALCLLLDVNMVGTILVIASAVLALALVIFTVYCGEATNGK